MQELNHFGIKKFIAELSQIRNKRKTISDRRESVRRRIQDELEAIRREEDAERVADFQVEKVIELCKTIEDRVSSYLENQKLDIKYHLGVKERQLEKELAAAQERIAQLEEQLDLKVAGISETEKLPLKKASTICIFDSLLFAIENWSTDGQVASDVSLCSQSVLFPLVYMPVMKGDTDYFVESFPSASLEVVRRGREFVKWLREESPTSLSDKDTWDVYADSVREWWVNDALPLIYGARSDDWVVSAAYSYDQMIKWRDLPATRALEFPLIFDAMELMSNKMDNIRLSVGLSDFTKKQMQTRLEP